ncbi:hypothetical protein AB0K60_11425 [Thermopolyspora sp. NPDC052614]|uniref:hypothetical protein n=1 Tax=Thermopolyspora sp. NPDC052614 TaxID=3155682 RepID=UPI003416E717
MKSSALKAALAGAAALAIAVSINAPAFAINKTSKNCIYRNPDQLLYIENYQGTNQHCFANAGFLNGLAIYGVNYIDPGRNRVSIWYYETVNSPSQSRMILEPGRPYDPYPKPPIHAITAIEIF